MDEKLIVKMLNAFLNGENFNYSDDNTTISVNPNHMSLKSISVKENNVDKEIHEFLNYCEGLDDELFIEVCDSFDNLKELEHNLDTDKYKETITIFKDRIKEIANNKLSEIVDAGKAEIERLELCIKDAQALIDDINEEINKAYGKYSV